MVVKSDNKSKTVADAQLEINFPSFNKDSAFHIYEQQIMFGPRIRIRAYIRNVLIGLLKNLNPLV